MTEEQVDGNGQAKGPPHPRCAAPGQKHIYVFMPQPDITVGELAESMELAMFGLATMVGASTMQICDLAFAVMQKETRRHWLVQDKPKVAVAQKPNRLHLPPGARG